MLNNGTSKSYKELSMLEEKDLLQIDEMKILAPDLKWHNGINPSVMPYVVAQSEELKELAYRINNPTIE